MFVVEDSELWVVRVGDVDKVIVTEESIGSNRPSGLQFCSVGKENWVIKECG